jgi:hypothetical protein
VENATFNTSIKQEYFERAADSWKERTIIFSAASQNEGTVYIIARRTFHDFKGTVQPFE